jgi:hypothetical protein
LAKASKAWVIKVTANLPRFCSSIESWILHDVQEPQLREAFFKFVGVGLAVVQQSDNFPIQLCESRQRGYSGRGSLCFSLGTQNNHIIPSFVWFLSRTTSKSERRFCQRGCQILLVSLLTNTGNASLYKDHVEMLGK